MRRDRGTDVRRAARFCQAFGGERQIACGSCGSVSSGTTTGSTSPPHVAVTDRRWDTWRQLQANGLVGYTADPERNLSIGDRDDCRRFAAFCRCRGLALDVSCGPRQTRVFRVARRRRVCRHRSAGGSGFFDFLKIIGLAEYLPFADGSFDHVLFSTTIDHCHRSGRPLAKPAVSLKRSRRSRRPAGRKDAKRPLWCRRVVPASAARPRRDLFHIERLTAERFRAFARDAELSVAAETCQTIDDYRRLVLRLRTEGVRS